MNGPEERDLERLLRRALQDEADRHQPAGDGLAKIRERIHGRRQRAAWLRPTLALAGTAAVAAAIVAGPSLLIRPETTPRLVDAASRSVPLSPTEPLGTSSGQSMPTSAPPTLRSAVPPSGKPSPDPASSWGTPIAGDSGLPDRVVAWPYPSRRIGYERADADVASGKYPNLVNPAQTAVDFVTAFVGSDQGLTATRLGPSGPGVQMLVQRPTADGPAVPVSNVFLIRVRPAADSPYVVVGASTASIGDGLSIFQVPALHGTDALPVEGNLRRPATVQAVTVRLSLREPGSTEDLGLSSVSVRLGGTLVQTWTAELAPLHELASTGVVAAWTTDEAGQVAEFVAAPTAP